MGSPYRKQGTTCLWCENSPSSWVLVAKLQTGAYQQMPRERICYHAVKVVNKFSQNLKAEQGPAGLWRGGVERGGGGGANIAQGEAAAGYKQSPWVTDPKMPGFLKSLFVCQSILSFPFSDVSLQVILQKPRSSANKPSLPLPKHPSKLWSNFCETADTYTW